jgi:hypothetical protein
MAAGLLDVVTRGRVLKVLLVSATLIAVIVVALYLLEKRERVRPEIFPFVDVS